MLHRSKKAFIILFFAGLMAALVGVVMTDMECRIARRNWRHRGELLANARYHIPEPPAVWRIKIREQQTQTRSSQAL